MPTYNEFEELLSNTILSFDNGILKLQSNINGNYIEFKALGYAQENEIFDKEYFGHYWTSSLGESNNANIFFFSSMIQIVDSDSRIYGRNIRPVKK